MHSGLHHTSQEVSIYAQFNVSRKVLRQVLTIHYTHQTTLETPYALPISHAFVLCLVLNAFSARRLELELIHDPRTDRWLAGDMYG